MFEVSLMVEDSKLAKLMWALDGLVVGQPSVLPVRGAEVVRSSKGTRVKAHKAVAEGTIFSRFIEKVVQYQGAGELTWQNFADWMQEAGGKRSSSAHAIHRLKEMGILAQAGKRGKYTVQITQQND